MPATGLALKSQPHVTSVRQWSRSVAIPRCQEPHSPDIELLWKDGEVVGERHLLDNRLGMAILKRLDRLAEREMYPCGGRGPVQTSTPAIRSHPFDWSLAVEALRTGDDKTVASALALVKGHEIDEIEDPSFFPGDGDEADDGIDLSHRFRSGYRDGERTWFTDFPPPAGFTGYESCDWGDPDEEYERECTPEERAVLDADAKRARAAARAEEEALRDSWLALLQEESCHPGLEQGPAFTSDEAAGSRNPPRGRAKSGSQDE